MYPFHPQAVHRDIAVRNFLVDCDGRVLLCDFGVTVFLPEGKDVFSALLGYESLRVRMIYVVYPFTPTVYVLAAIPQILIFALQKCFT